MIDALRVLGQFLCDPGRVGAIAPSGAVLAWAMVRALGPVGRGQVIVELGAGTGAFTRRLRRRHPDNPLVAVEYSRDFAELLRRRYPEVTVVHGCASRVGEELRRLSIATDRIAGVVSGLPLVSLPRQVQEAILAAIAAVLPPGRPYVQFTYRPDRWRRLATPGLELVATRSVWLNLPPATVLTFMRVGASAGPIP